MSTHVIIYASPGDRRRVRLCETCERDLTGSGDWPRDWAGAECCTVAQGRHEGRCDRCEPDEMRAPWREED